MSWSRIVCVLCVTSSAGPIDLDWDMLLWLSFFIAEIDSVPTESYYCYVSMCCLSPMLKETSAS